jgi:hypothetical protein
MATKPPLPVVTLYGLGISGQVFKTVGKLAGHGRTDFIAGNYMTSYGGGAPYVSLVPPGKRNALRYERGWGESRYLLVLKGTGHPDPIPLRLGDENNAHRDFRLLEPWDALINAHIARYRVPVLADYRDIINDPKLRRAILVDERKYGRTKERPDLADVDVDIPVPSIDD